MLTFKPKKVFEKLNKMDRKQAYTIGAIVIVSVVALLMLVSAVSTKDESFEGMAARGYDLANMPFATDQAEQYLLAAKYPDMRENGSTLLYSAAEKEARQEEDAQKLEEELGSSGDSGNESPYDDNTSAARSDNGGYGGYAGGRGGGNGRGRTEIGQLSSSGMASAGGSGIGATYGPTGDFRQFKGRENKGNETPVTLNTGNARQALAQFRQGSRAAASFKENKMTGARKALMGGNVAGSDAIGKDGIDLSKLPSGGLTLDTDAPPSSTDLDNLDKQVEDAAKKADPPEKPEEKLGFWEQLGQDLLRQAASSLVDSIMGGIGDSIKGSLSANKASRSARNEYGAGMAGKKWESLTDTQKAELTKNGIDENTWNNASTKQQRKYGRNTASGWAAGNTAKRNYLNDKVTYVGQQDTNSDPCKNVNCPDEYTPTKVGNTCSCKKKSS